MSAERFTTPETLPLDESGKFSFARLMALAIPMRLLIIAMGILSVQVAKPGQIDTSFGFGTGTPWLAFDGNYYRSIATVGYPMQEAGYRVTGHFDGELDKDGKPKPFTIIFRAKDEAGARKLAEGYLLNIDKLETIITPPTIIAFFPLYPGLGHLLSFLVGGTVAGLIVVSNICSVIGIGFFYCWVRDLFDARRAFWASLFMTAWPGAVFFSAALTEGLFFMLVTMVLYFMTRRKLYTAALICGISALSRPTAVAVIATLGLWSIFATAGMALMPRLGKLVLIGAIAASGGVAYELFLWHRYDDPLAYSKAQQHWEDLTAVEQHHRATLAYRASHPELFPVTPDAVATTNTVDPDAVTTARRGSLQFYIDKAVQPSGWNRALAGVIGLFIVMGLLMPLGMPRVLMALPLIIFVMGGVPNHFLRVGSSHRYTVGAPPLFLYMSLLLARLMPKGEPLLKFAIGGAFMIQMYYAWLFSRGYWVG